MCRRRWRYRFTRCTRALRCGVARRMSCSASTVSGMGTRATTGNSHAVHVDVRIDKRYTRAAAAASSEWFKPPGHADAHATRHAVDDADIDHHLSTCTQARQEARVDRPWARCVERRLSLERAAARLPARTHARTHARMHARTCAHAHMRVCTHVCPRMRARTHVCMLMRDLPTGVISGGQAGTRRALPMKCIDMCINMRTDVRWTCGTHRLESSCQGGSKRVPECLYAC